MRVQLTFFVILIILQGDSHNLFFVILVLKKYLRYKIMQIWYLLLINLFIKLIAL